MFKRKLTKNYAKLEILVPCLNNSAEEPIFENNKIKEGYETMALQKEGVNAQKHKIHQLMN